MKKIVSMILVIALFASLAVVASAHSKMKYPENFVEHAYMPREGVTMPGGIPGEICDFYMTLDTIDVWPRLGTWFATQEYRRSSDMTDILDITDGVSLGRVKCAEAITSDDMEAAVAEWNAVEAQQIKHMTVFYQRNLTVDGEGDVAVSLKLWPAAKKNAVVVLGQFDGVWKIVAVSETGTDVVENAPLTGATGMTVCMTW